MHIDKEKIDRERYVKGKSMEINIPVTYLVEICEEIFPALLSLVRY